MSDLKVTVVIPCYNGEKFIKDAIEHLLNQTRPADQLIVVDDGSTDNSPAIIDSFQEITVIRHDRNLGLPTGRNNAWKNAVGDIVIFVDVDAYAEPDFVENILRSYVDSDVAGVGGAGYEIHGKPMANYWRQQFLSQNYGPEPRDDIKFLFGIGISFRKEVLEEMGGFDPAFHTNGEDVEICLRIKKSGKRFLYAPGAKLYHHRDDTLKSLSAMIYRWWFWGHMAHKKNAVPYFREHVKETWQMMRWIMKQSIKKRNVSLILINLIFFCVAHIAIFRAELQGLPSREGEL